MSLVPALDKVPPVYQPDQCYREEGCLCVSYILLPTNANLQAYSALAKVSVGFPFTVTGMGLVALKNPWRAKQQKKLP